jgi:SNF2 family DNA or RNA helicase
VILTPHPYQGLGRDFILDHQRCCIWADPGMGKTVMSYSAMDILWLAGSHFWPALIIGPKRVARSVWTRERDKWDDFQHLRVSAMIGTEQERRDALKRKADIYTINFENIEWLMDTLGHNNWPFKIVIVDEATKLKGFRLRNSTQRSKALASICRRVGRWVNLTGTPASNGYKDLWGQLYFIDLGERLGKSYTAYMDMYSTTNEYSHETTFSDHAKAAINERLQDVCLTIRAKDWFDLKEPIRRTIEVDMPNAARATYRELAKEMYAQLADGTEISPINAAGLSAKCLQLASGAVIVEGKQWKEVHNAKMEALESLHDEINGEPLMVGYWWRHDRERLLKKFPYARVIDTKKDEDDWNAGKIPMALTHYASVGHGLDLQYGGHRLVHFSRWWDLELDEQLFNRIGPVRQFQAGFDRPMFEYSIVTRDTVDELVPVRHTMKKEVQDLLMNSTRRFA